MIKLSYFIAEDVIQLFYQKNIKINLQLSEPDKITQEKVEPTGRNDDKQFAFNNKRKSMRIKYKGAFL